MVVAPDGTAADSLTKAVAVLGHGRGLALLQDHAGTAGLVLRLVDGQVEIEETANFKNFE